jgi:ribosome-associated protein
LLDYTVFVVHIFLAEQRAFYDIERPRESAKSYQPAEFKRTIKHYRRGSSSPGVPVFSAT